MKKLYSNSKCEQYLLKTSVHLAHRVGESTGPVKGESSEDGQGKVGLAPGKGEPTHFTSSQEAERLNHLGLPGPTESDRASDGPRLLDNVFLNLVRTQR